MSNLSLIKKDTVDVVQEKIDYFQKTGELEVPKNYSPANALKAAWLRLQEISDRNGKPALEVCSKASIMNSLLDMVVQGLNPSKEQCYFIPYGKKLVCMRSYFGSMALVKRMANAKDVYAHVVRAGDQFEFEMQKGRQVITTHKQTLDSLKGEVKAAYAVIEFTDDKPDYVEIMTIDDIKQAWKQGKVYKEGKGTHADFTEEMAKKTVINRACKRYINSSSDDNLLSYHATRADEEVTEQEVEQEIDEEANTETIDVEVEETKEDPVEEEKPEESYSEEEYDPDAGF